MLYGTFQNISMYLSGLGFQQAVDTIEFTDSPQYLSGSCPDKWIERAQVLEY